MEHGRFFRKISEKELFEDKLIIRKIAQAAEKNIGATSTSQPGCFGVEKKRFFKIQSEQIFVFAGELQEIGRNLIDLPQPNWTVLMIEAKFGCLDKRRSPRRMNYFALDFIFDCIPGRN